ncbi:MAG: hypothetical protein K5665_02460 [Saccharofermentans sp.]|nr:hypothetical protein [Saccharofermentans sp.]
MNNPVKLFIVEGEVRDFRFVNYMTKCFFSTGRFQAKIINLPAAQNIYMLYKSLKEDDFDTDVVELLRDKVPSAQKILEGISRDEIDEVYLFFDYDTHQKNVPWASELTADDIVKTLLSFFNNETEYGKMYLSYPMVEALYDYIPMMCQSFTECYIPLDQVGDYKRISTDGNPKARVHFNISEWSEVLAVFVLRIKCLFDLADLSYELYRDIINPESIFDKVVEIKQDRNSVFVLSCFPEFLFDYHRIDFWNTFAKLKHFKFDNCTK